MRLWPEGKTREERIALREAEDKLRAELWEQHKHLEVGSDEWRNSELMRFTRWINDRYEELERTLGNVKYKEPDEMATRGRPKKGNEKADKLLAALDFVKVATKDTGQGAYQQHAHIANGLIVAFDGVLAAGHPIEEDLQAYPHVGQLSAALKTCGKQLSLTIEGDTIAVKGDKLRATVQCLPAGQMHVVTPDENLYKIDDGIKTALEVATRYTREGATLIHECAVLLCANSAYGTNGKAIVEYWHGTNLPDMIIPRAFAVAVVKAKSKLVGFGYGDGRSVTFHFDDGSWLKTQLYAEGYPMSAKTLLNVSSAPVPVPVDFVTAVQSVAAFSEDGSIVIEKGQVIGFHMNSETAAEYDVKDLSAAKRLRYDAANIAKVGDLIKSVDFNSDPDKLLWFGDSVRGACIRITEGDEVPF